MFCTDSKCMVDEQSSDYACEDVCGEVTYRCGDPLDEPDSSGSSSDGGDSGGSSNNGGGGGGGGGGSTTCDLTPRYQSGITGYTLLNCKGREWKKKLAVSRILCLQIYSLSSFPHCTVVPETWNHQLQFPSYILCKLAITSLQFPVCKLIQLNFPTYCIAN